MLQAPDVLVVSTAFRFGHRQKRGPLSRLIVPVDKVPEYLRQPLGRVWWAEKQGSRLWLRGYGQVEYTVEETVLSERVNRRLVWHLSPWTSERLTFPGDTRNVAANITELFGYELLHSINGIWVGQIDTMIRKALENCQLNIAESTWSFEVARHHVQQLVHKAKLTQAVADLKGNLDKAWMFGRQEFVRAELLKIDRRDEYEVTAAILAGHETMPSNWKPDADQIVGPTEKGIAGFHDLNPDEVAITINAWCRREDIALTAEALERSSQRHQQILKLLACTLKARGLLPTYSRLVDLRAILPAHDIFFEIKTATDQNFLHQVRLAVGQLQEYRFRYRQNNGGKPIELAAVVENCGVGDDVRFARNFLSQLGIHLVLADVEQNCFSGLAKLVN